MKKLIWTYLFLLFISAAAYAQASKFVRCSGKNFTDAAGKILSLKGINLGNWLNPEGYMLGFKDISSYRKIDEAIKELIGSNEAEVFWKSFRDNYITREDIHFIKSTGANHIRVPFNFKLFLVEDCPEIYLDEGFKRLDDVIKWCREENLYVILDMHAAPGGQTGDNIDDSWSYPFLYENKEAQETTINLWKKIAARYKDEAIVIGYDLLNEPIPHYLSNKEELNLLLEPLYKKITEAIRSVDKNHIVIIGGAQWDTNFKMFTGPFDKNFAYTFHAYWMPVLQKAIQDHVDMRDKYNVPIWLGESGENTDEWIDSFRVLLDRNNIGWCFWPYKKMNAKSCFASFNVPAGWDEIVKFAEGPRKSFEEIRKNKPSRETVRKALNDLLENMKFKNCTVNPGYLKSLGLSTGN